MDINKSQKLIIPTSNVSKNGLCYVFKQQKQPNQLLQLDPPPSAGDPLAMPNLDSRKSQAVESPVARWNR